MERKNRNQKRAILVLTIVCVLLVGLIVFLQVRMSTANARAREKYDGELQEMTAKMDELQAAYDSATVEGREEVGYDAIEDAMKAESKEKKAQVKDLEGQKKDLLKAAEEAAAAEETAAAEAAAAAEKAAEDAAAAAEKAAEDAAANAEKPAAEEPAATEEKPAEEGGNK